MPLLLQFESDSFHIFTGIKCDITYLSCAFFDDRTIFELLANI